MACFVLVHGGNMTTETWNRLTIGNPVCVADGLMGGRIWDPVKTALETRGHRAFAPTLSDEHCSTLSDHIGQICTLIEKNDPGRIILAGHSYGGMVITGVAAEMPRRIRRLVYVDAALPDPGQSLFDLIASGGRDPLSFAGLEPAPPYVEKLQFDAGKIRQIPKTYILCTKSEFAVVTSVARSKIAAAENGWTYREIPSSHVPMADMPEEFSRLMLDAAME